MADPVDMGTDAAVSDYKSRVASGEDPGDAAKAALAAGAAVAGAAACAATGVGTAAAPLCGIIAGGLAGPIIDAAEDVWNGIKGWFGGDDPPKPVRFTAADYAKHRWTDADRLYVQLRALQCGMRAAYASVAETTAGKLRELGQSATTESVMASLRDAGLPLSDTSDWRLQDPPGENRWECIQVQKLADGTAQVTAGGLMSWHYDTAPPDVEADAKRLHVEQYAASPPPEAERVRILTYLVALQEAWIVQLQTLAGAILVGATTRKVLLEEASKPAPPIDWSAVDWAAVKEYARAVEGAYYARRGISSGVKFLRSSV